MGNSIDQQFIEYIVKSLVSKPDFVKIERTIDEKGVLLELTVDPEDLGRVIGKRGATAQSLRTLLRALGTKNDARYNLKIVDNGEPRPPRDNTGVVDDQAAVSEDTAPAAADEENVSNEQEEPPEEQNEENQPEDTAGSDKEESVADRTRKELADLDDLDV